MTQSKLNLLRTLRCAACALPVLGLMAFATPASASDNVGSNELKSVDQQNTVTVTVVDATGEPIIGAHVVVGNSAKGGITNVDGIATVEAAQGETLKVSYVGYATRTVTVSGSNMSVVLNEDNTQLDEVVVVGYGTMRKSDVTGSIAVAKGKDMLKAQNFSAVDNLRGKASGVTVFSNSDQPGIQPPRVLVRGIATINASSDPLYVVDGVVMNNFALVNPNDIESMEVLKDASATAIYGARGANGVIMVTTKRGLQGETGTKISYQGSVRVSTLARKMDVMNAQEWCDAWMKGLENENKWNGYNWSMNRTDWFNDPNYFDANGNPIYDTDWQKEIFRTTFSQEVNASVAGSYETQDLKTFQMPYRVSAGFLNSNGVLKTTDMKRGTVGLNLTPTLLDSRLKINLNAKGVYTHNDFADEGAIAQAVLYDPLKPVFDANGIHGYTAWLTDTGASNTMSTLNPVAQLEDQSKSSNIRRFIGNAQFDYSFKYVPGLRANLNLGLDISTTTGFNTVNEGSEVSFHDKAQNGSGMHENYGQLRRDQTLEFYLAYARELKPLKSRFDVMAGYSWQHFYNSTTDKKVPLNTDLAQSLAYTPYTATESYLVSFYGRLNWTLQDKYYFTFTLRDDGTSRFKNNKWGLFPSAAFGWRISDEPLFQQMKNLSNLKLRLGWGITGQQNINQGDYPSFATYRTNTSAALYRFGNAIITPFTPNAYAADIKWESTTTYNIGLDYGFFNNRVNGSIDWYYRKTTDLLNDVDLAAITNLSNHALMNIGDMYNTGVEFSLNVVPVENKDWHWEIGYNFAVNKNRITKLIAAKDPTYIGVQTGGISGGTGNQIQVNSVGYPMRSFYVFQQAYDQNGKPLEGVYVDRNGDGQVTDADLYRYKKPDADITMGLNTTLSYKKWTLSAALRANLGNYVYNNVASKAEMKADMWTNSFIENRLSTAAFSNFAQAQYRSDYYVQNASFLKLDKITLAYDVCKWLRLHATAQNVFTITNYDGLDPEVESGIDYNFYPRPLTVLFGASFNF